MEGDVQTHAKESVESDKSGGDASRMRASMDKLEKATQSRVGESVLKIPVTLDIILGRITMTFQQVMALRGGETISLGRRMGQSVELRVNNTLIGKADLVVCEEGEPMLAISITELCHEGI